ncbi:hypothetical protein B0A48_10276 [Cryoendolithus antarcticus]|uniref:Myb-like domain-containing protein n=1 Tax=Cryoendolithus antarcticus TaxID=1507870 RepID=A0A1V8SX44_9PEZI|nr:hypothetical protein B0A48_10276 [Cryoendolithus antarcticus]
MGREDGGRPDWVDREHDYDRARRDVPPPRITPRASTDSLGPSTAQQPAAPYVNPERQAMLESAGVDVSIRRPSLAPLSASHGQVKRESTGNEYHLDGRAEAALNRYGSRAASPPPQAPAVPAFTLSFTPQALGTTPSHAQRAPATAASAGVRNDGGVQSSSAPFSAPLKVEGRSSAAPVNRQYPNQSMQQQPTKIIQPTATPIAPRSVDSGEASPLDRRVQPRRSWEAPAGTSGNAPPSMGGDLRNPSVDTTSSRPSNTLHNVPETRLGRVSQPESPRMQQHARMPDQGPPQGPKAPWPQTTQSSQNSRAPFALSQGPYSGQPQSAGFVRPKTPPPTAPSGPRNRAVSVSPKVLHNAVPTAPKAIRPPPPVPRVGDRAPSLNGRPPGGVSAAHQWAPPTAPRASQQWNQWKRPGVTGPSAAPDRAIPPKRESNADDLQSGGMRSSLHPDAKHAHAVSTAHSIAARIAPPGTIRQDSDRMDISHDLSARKTVTPTGYSARSSFFGQPQEKSEEETGTSDAADESLSTSEEEDLEIEDPTLFEAKFERQKRELEKKLADLSVRHLRSVTPLEAIARTVRVTWEDVERVRERDAKMDIDDPQQRQPLATTSESDEMVDVVTPKGEDAASVVIKEQPDATLPVRTLRRPSPEVVLLPHLHRGGEAAFQDTKEYQRKLNRQERETEAMLVLLDAEMADEQGEEDELTMEFHDRIWDWYELCEDLDKVREVEEARERQQSAEPPPEPEITSFMPTNPALQSRIKYNSEYEFEMVLKQSEETARLEQERADRELLKIQADMEKEAVVPEQMTAKQMDAARFIDNNRLRDPDSLTMVFSYEAPPDDFLEHEKTIFAAAFRDTPKRWSDIADQLPGREPKDCIRHYYANKWDGRYKDKKGGRKKGGTRGRGGKSAPRGKGSAAMADMARIEEHVPGVSDSGRPKRAAAPTTFGEREMDAKAMLAKDSPVKRPNNGEVAQDKPVKRRKAAGDKPGRKSKAAAVQQPLAQLAAAPSMSPAQRYMTSIIPAKEEPMHDRRLDDARLLADMQAGTRLAPENHSVYVSQQPFVASGPIPVDAGDEYDRANVLSIASSRQSASSYWSVPEQNDFSKYIMHFGTDFAAIANHMGTKTQTMIKNHYQRSVDGGNRPELEAYATQANKRRERGEDMGAPPTPTPINKRKYDNPPNPGQRTLPSQDDAMDVDEPAIMQRPQSMKHASPPQFQSQPSFVTSAQATPVQAPRVAPSPVSIPATASTPLAPPAALSRSSAQQPMGSHVNIFGDSRPESRVGFPPGGAFRHLQQAATSGQPPPLSRPIKDAHDSSFISSLREQQEEAMRMQGHYHEQDREDRFDISRHRATMQQLNNPHMRRSPGNQPLQMQEERKPIIDERASQHSRQFPPPDGPLRRLPESPIFGGDMPPLGQHPASIRRLPLDPMPPMRGDPRQAQLGMAQAPRPSITPAQDPAPPPKRSNVMSLLNSEPEEPKPPPQRAVSDIATAGRLRGSIDSPVGHAHTMAPLAPPTSTFSRPTFGQPAAPQSAFQRMPFGPSSNMSSPQPVKQETPLSGNATPRQNLPPKADWAARVLGQSSQSSPANAAQAPALEREVRPYYSHRSSLLGGIGDVGRANPSPPPPRMLMGHSRTPSLTGQGPTQPPRERAGFLPSQQQQQQSQQQGGGTTGPSLQGSAFSQPAPPPFGHSLSRPPQDQLRHGHNTSISGGFPTLQQQQQHQRTQSRDDIIRSEQQLFNARQQQQHQEQEWQQRMQDERRMREEQDRRLHEERDREQQQRRMQDERRMQQEQHERRSQDEQRRMQEDRETEHRRREQQFIAQREHERQQQQGQQQQMQPPFGRSLGPQGMVPQPQPLQQQQQPQPFNPASAAFDDRPSAAGIPSLREQSMREAHDRFQQEHEREQRMRREAAGFGQREPGEEGRRREGGEGLFGRRGTPLGGAGGFGQPQQPPPPGQGGEQPRR